MKFAFEIQGPISRPQRAKHIKDLTEAFFTVPAKNKNDEILFYRDPYQHPSDGVPNGEMIGNEVKTMMRNISIYDFYLIFRSLLGLGFELIFEFELQIIMSVYWV